MNMGGTGTAPFVFSLISAIRYFPCSWSKSTCHDQGQMKSKKRGRITQLLSKHGRLLVLEVSRPILTQNSRELLSLVPCEYVNRSISICYGNSFAKCANQTSSRVIFSLSPQQGNSEIPRFPPELSDIAGIPKGFPLSIILHIGMHMHTIKSQHPSDPCIPATNCGWPYRSLLYEWVY